MMAPLGSVFGFFDVALVRYLFALAVDYLIATGFLMPEQRETWVNGGAHLLGVLGFVVFTAIWQYKSHHKPKEVDVTLKTDDTTDKIETLSPSAKPPTSSTIAVQSDSLYLPGQESGQESGQE